jgi:ankyrin repeat protein
MAGYLISRGAEPNAKTPDGNTALHFAVTTGKIGLVRLLLQKGASVNIRNNCGSTPLHAAVSEWIFPDIVEYLIQNGASPSAQDKSGYTPLHIIRQRGDDGVRAAEILLRNGGDPLIRARNGDMASHTAIKRGNWAIFKLLLEAGALVNAEGAKGRSVLHIAAKFGRSTFIEPLIKLGAKTGVVGPDGYTPKDYAGSREDEYMITLLARHNASKPEEIQRKALSLQV